MKVHILKWLKGCLYCFKLAFGIQKRHLWLEVILSFLNFHGFYRTLPIIIKHTFKSLYFGIQMSKLAFKMQKWHLTFMK